MLLFDHAGRAGRPGGRRGAVVRPHAARRCSDRGAELLAIPLESDGIDVGALEAALAAGAGPKLAHTIPNFHNPAGCTLSLRTSASGCVELAPEHDFLIFEDDPYGEVRFEGEDLPTMLSLDERGPRRLRELVLEDDRARRARRLPDRPGRPDRRDDHERRSTPTSRRTCSRRRSSASSAARARSSESIATVKAALRERARRARRGARAQHRRRGAVRGARGRLLPVGRAARGRRHRPLLEPAAAERGVTLREGQRLHARGRRATRCGSPTRRSRPSRPTRACGASPRRWRRSGNRRPAARLSKKRAPEQRVWPQK